MHGCAFEGAVSRKISKFAVSLCGVVGAARFRRIPGQQCGRTSKLERCELTVVVTSHILTHKTLSCGDTTRWGRGHDRPFLHSYTKVSTPVHSAIWFTSCGTSGGSTTGGAKIPRLVGKLPSPVTSCRPCIRRGLEPARVVAVERLRDRRTHGGSLSAAVKTACQTAKPSELQPAPGLLHHPYERLHGP